jgi:O-antigen ligase
MNATLKYIKIPNLLSFCVYFLVLLMPLSWYWEIGQPLHNDILAIYVTPVLYVTDLAALPALLFGLLLALKKTKTSNTLLLRNTKHIHMPLIGIVVLGVLSIPLAFSPPLALYSAIRWVLALCLYLIFQSKHINSKKTIQVFLVGLVLQALVGLGQFLTRGPLGIPTEMALEIGTPDVSTVAFLGARTLRAYGLTFNPNVLGGFMAAGVLLCMPYLKELKWRIIWGILWLGLLLTFSRSAALSVLFTVPFILYWTYQSRTELRRPILITSATLLVAGLILSPVWIPSMRSRLKKPLESIQIVTRIEMVEIAVQRIAERPALGVGAGNFPLAMIGRNKLSALQFVHNVPLLLAAEVGVLGGAAWVWLWIMPVVLALKNGYHVARPTLGAVLMAAFAIGIIALWDSYPWSLESGRLLSIMLFGLLVGGFRQNMQEGEE